LITGGAGYLGSVLTKHLLEKGHEVTCLDNLMYNQQSLIPFARYPKFEFIYGDVRDKNLVQDAIKNATTIIPLAGIVGMPACNRHPIEADSTNRDAILMMNDLRNSDQKVIYPNTNSGYGIQSGGSSYCDETTPLKPISRYGITKCEAEDALLSGKKDAVTLRLATVFGISPRMRTDLLVNDFTLQAMREGAAIIYQGDFKRNYIHVQDVARCFEHCMLNFNEMKNQPYNLGLDDANLTKTELAKKIKEHIPNFELIFREFAQDPDKRNYLVSNKKILSTGFKPEVSLDDGIEELIRGYKILLKLSDSFKNI